MYCSYVLVNCCILQTQITSMYVYFINILIPFTGGIYGQSDQNSRNTRVWPNWAQKDKRILVKRGGPILEGRKIDPELVVYGSEGVLSYLKESLVFYLERNGSGGTLYRTPCNIYNNEKDNEIWLL